MVELSLLRFLLESLCKVTLLISEKAWIFQREEVRIKVIEKAKRPCQSKNQGVLTYQSSSDLSVTPYAISRRTVLK